MVIRAFRKCGISVAIDSSEDDKINIKGLGGYQVESDNDDLFATSEDDSDGLDSGDEEHDNEEDNDKGRGNEEDSDEEDDNEEDGDKENSDEDNFAEENCDVPFIVPFHSTTNEEYFLPPANVLDYPYCVEFKDVAEDYFRLFKSICSICTNYVYPPISYMTVLYCCTYYYITYLLLYR